MVPECDTFELYVAILGIHIDVAHFHAHHFSFFVSPTVFLPHLADLLSPAHRPLHAAPLNMLSAIIIGIHVEFRVIIEGKVSERKFSIDWARSGPP